MEGGGSTIRQRVVGAEINNYIRHFRCKRRRRRRRTEPGGFESHQPINNSLGTGTFLHLHSTLLAFAGEKVYFLRPPRKKKKKKMLRTVDFGGGGASQS